MPKPVWEYSDEEWERLSEQEKADSLGIVAEALKRTLDRFDGTAPMAKERWEALKSSLDEAIKTRSDHLRKSWGIKA